jgi:hypothetical protein
VTLQAFTFAAFVTTIILWAGWKEIRWAWVMASLQKRAALAGLLIVWIIMVTIAMSILLGG